MIILRTTAEDNENNAILYIFLTFAVITIAEIIVVSNYDTFRGGIESIKSTSFLDLYFILSDPKARKPKLETKET